jgi:hypothetical protein
MHVVITDPWMVVAAVCSCGGTAVTILDTSTLGPDAPDEAEHDGEVVATGPDWRPLPTQVATEMARRTGTTILARCTVVSIREQQERDQVADEAIRLLYQVADRQAVAR